MNIRLEFPVPMMDRIDIRVDVPSVSAADLIGRRPGEPSSLVAKRVRNARELQAARFHDAGYDLQTNAQMSASMAENLSEIDKSGEHLLREAAEAMRFSARAYHRILKVARTIADLENSPSISKLHLAEAIAYRGASTSLAAAA